MNSEKFKWYISPDEAQRAYRQLSGLREQYLHNKTKICDQSERNVKLRKKKKACNNTEKGDSDKNDTVPTLVNITPCGAFMRGYDTKHIQFASVDGEYDSESEFHDKVR